MANEVTLGARLDTAAAAGLKEELASAPDGDLVLNCNNVTQLGGLCLEILMIAASRRKSNGHDVTFADPSDQMVEDLGRFGLTPETLLEVAV